MEMGSFFILNSQKGNESYIIYHFMKRFSIYFLKTLNFRKIYCIMQSIENIFFVFLFEILQKTRKATTEVVANPKT